MYQTMAHSDHLAQVGEKCCSIRVSVAQLTHRFANDFESNIVPPSPHVTAGRSAGYCSYSRSSTTLRSRSAAW